MLPVVTDTQVSTVAGDIVFNLQCNINSGPQRARTHVLITVPLGNLYGRGASDNKAPVLAWIHAVEAYQALKMVSERAHSNRLMHPPALDCVHATGNKNQQCELQTETKGQIRAPKVYLCP